MILHTSYNVYHPATCLHREQHQRSHSSGFLWPAQPGHSGPEQQHPGRLVFQPKPSVGESLCIVTALFFIQPYYQEHYMHAVCLMCMSAPHQVPVRGCLCSQTHSGAGYIIHAFTRAHFISHIMSSCGCRVSELHLQSSLLHLQPAAPTTALHRCYF